jgi:hypothetical protein
MNFGQGISGYGRAFAHEDLNLTAQRLFRQRSIRHQSPLTVVLRRANLGSGFRQQAHTCQTAQAGGMDGSGIVD